MRFFLPNLSSGIRYRRAEGLLLGGGVSWRPSGRTAVYGWLGYPFERRRAQAALRLSRGLGGSTLSLDGYADRHGDAGPFPAASGLVSSFGAAFRGDDYVDSYYRSGGAVSLVSPIGGWTGTAGVTWETIRSAELVADPITGAEPRSVRPVTDGTDLYLELGAERSLGMALSTGWSLVLSGQLAGAESFGYTRWIGSLEARPPDPDAVWQWEASVGAGIATGELPEHRLLLVGGRGTVPGYEFRAWGGDRAAFALVSASRAAWAPWVRFRVSVAAGWAEQTSISREAAERFSATGSDGVRTSLGAGIALLWDLVRIDAARGLEDGRWEWMVSANPAWRAPL